MELGKFTLAPGLRLDMFDFQYMDALQSSYKTESNSTSILSPKVNVLYNPLKRLQIYLKTGKGFHSNDTRVAVTKSGKEVLPAAYGADLGFIWKATSRIILNVAVWELYLEQEFVYVGDEGIVEPSGKTSRRGVDLSARYQALDWLFFNFDMNHTIARSLNSRSGEDYIPLAPDMTLVASLNARSRSGLYGGLHARYLGDRPANEDNSILAKGYTVLDLNLGYEAKRIDVGASIQNVLNTEWNETQFATTSRLQDELESVEEIHFTPGTPFFLKGKITYKF
jgi:outer membrane receptor protein involved in Fe transport